MTNFLRLAPLTSILILLLALAGCSGSGGNEPPEPPTDTSPPAAPATFTAASGDGQIALNWEAPGDADVEGYNLYRATEPLSSVTGRSPVNGALIEDVTYDDGVVTNGTTYYYRVTAVDDNENESDPSVERSATPFPTPPDRP